MRNKRALRYTLTIAAISLPVFLFLGDVPFLVWFHTTKWWQMAIMLFGVLLVALFIYNVFAWEFEDDEED
jgi:hypothetical protein